MPNNPLDLHIPSSILALATVVGANETTESQAVTVAVLLVSREASASLFPVSSSGFIANDNGNDDDIIQDGDAGFLGSSVVSINISNVASGQILDEAIVMDFRVDFVGAAATFTRNETINETPNLLLSPSCSFWDFSLSTQVKPTDSDPSLTSTIVGGWNPDGCTTLAENDITTGRVTCKCEHLTHFGVIFQAKAAKGGSDFAAYKSHTKRLTLITYVATWWQAHSFSII
jgi:hypothetical protein